MLERTLNTILSDPNLIPAYLFMAFLLAALGWHAIKFIIFIIRHSGGRKK